MSRLIAQLLDQDTSKLPQFIRELGIDRAAQAVLVELRLLSNVAAASLGQHIHSSKPGHKVLTFAGGEPSETQILRRYLGCKTDDSRVAVITDGLAEIRAVRYSPRPSLDLGTKEGRLEVGRDTRPVRVVANAYRISIGTVHNWRKEAAAHDAKWGPRSAA